MQLHDAVGVGGETRNEDGAKGKWGSVFNYNVPAPGRQGDSATRSACYSRLGPRLPDEEGMELPPLDALAKEVQWELQKVKDLEDVVVGPIGCIGAMNDRHSHPLSSAYLICR